MFRYVELGLDVCVHDFLPRASSARYRSISSLAGTEWRATADRNRRRHHAIISSAYKPSPTLVRRT